MKTRPIPRLLNQRTGDSHYHWTKKWGAGHYVPFFPSYVPFFPSWSDEHCAWVEALDVGQALVGRSGAQTAKTATWLEPGQRRHRTDRAGAPRCRKAHVSKGFQVI